MNKICTSIEQSKKLIELGIDVNTADMCWQNNEFPIGFNDDDAFPAWSLSILFKMLPKSAYLERGSFTELCRVNLPIELKCSDWYLDPIDALFEITCSLLEEK